ncbi:histidine phosphatase family protein [Bifidobacterium cuniculi]|uniref:Phosphoglycerate mutase n=1 Tax=Bifidobacterium cuniculi TaxID=1688 RepID=A0A087AQE0_9BIFI|nr:histidine phosphatase family protein [Bifidobacterium cuniculi]KFI60990.1 phosphoglycerate mutase [Bifidobacterium cuniculi]
MIDEVIIQRHGRTSFNLARRLQGQVDIPLDIVGQWQADHSAYALAARLYWAKVANIARHPDLLPQSDDPEVRRSDIEEYRLAPASDRTLDIVCSDLFRARQTAHATADILGLPVRLDPRLRERSFGQWEGMTREEIRERYPQGFASWTAHEGGETDYGVETRQAVGERGARAIESLVVEARETPGHGTLLVVSHGSWTVATVATLLGMDVDDLSTLGAMRNAFWCTLHVSEHDDGFQWLLDEYNQGPALASTVDWENGPDTLHNPAMGSWKAVKGAKA